MVTSYMKVSKKEKEKKKQVYIFFKFYIITSIQQYSV